MFAGMGPWEMGILLVIVIIIFGVGKLGEVGGALGNAIREFREASNTNDDKEADESQAKIN